ncbi:TRAP transporter substrate-binding protein [Desulfopila aestuarii]|uniref:Tripartite ATP-independent transporter solute receptor, DctP family n=1 Tax=Desulfopila aestuarii DSM 18488 TaxID=1121416 RepID=A0A1M7YLT6_9BACT|nr:TRAP transporter substrate-binding protein DctP [Desulfopila aestuarii]SHO53562.1 tripartite ATP-independent transporter solute receptor, DctP family [Desulfopila aestuarii DSM 18488]
MNDVCTKMKGLRKIGLGCLLALAIPSASMAGTIIKMSYNGPPKIEENAVHAFASTFKETVEKETGGNLIIELYPNSQLGSEEQRMEQVMTSPMINVASFGGMETVFPEMFATNVPFMFESYKAAHIFFDTSSFMEKARKELRARVGVDLLEVVEEGGFIAFTSKKPIKSPADFKGMKFRAMDASQVAMYEAFGASGTPIPWTEVYLALKMGVADGQMNPPTYIILGSLFEVQEYLTLANVQYSDQFLLINAKLIDSLSPKEQEIVRKAAHDANVKTREYVESQVDDRVKFLIDKGMKAYTPNAEEMAAFKKLGSPSYIDWLSKQIDASWIDLALSDAEKANKGAK